MIISDATLNTIREVPMIGMMISRLRADDVALTNEVQKTTLSDDRQQAGQRTWGKSAEIIVGGFESGVYSSATGSISCALKF